MKNSNFIPIFFNTSYKFLSNFIVFFWPIHLQSLNLTGLQIGTLISCLSITSLLNTLPAGLCNDRMKSKYLITLGLSLYSFFLLSVSFTETYIYLIPLYIIGGIGKNFFQISIDSLFFRLNNDKNTLNNIKKYNGYYLLFAGIGILTGSQLLSFFSFNILLRIISSIAFILAIYSVFIPSTETFHCKLSSYKKTLFKSQNIIFLTIFFLIALHYGAENTSYALFLKHNLHLTNKETGIFISIPIMLMFFWSNIAANLIQKGASLNKILYLGLLLSGFGHIAMAYPNLYFSLLSRIVHEAGDAFLFIALYYGISRIFPIKKIGGLSSSINFTNTIAATIGALIFSSLGEKIGFQYPIIISGILTLLALIPCLFFQIHYKKD